MIWLAWRLVRTQVAVIFGVLAVIAIVLAVTGPHLVQLYDTTVATCAGHGDCANVTAQFAKNDRLLQQLGVVVLVAPALIGMFWGAPLVARELETGTHKLAWTQSVSRTRWLAVKIGVSSLAAIAVAGVLSLMVTWWSSPFDRLGTSPFSPTLFDRRDIVPVAYTAFALALGVAAGILIRRTLPAMAATLVAFVAVRFVIFEWVRPRLVSPLMTTTPLNAQQGVTLGPAGYAYGHLSPSNWFLSEQTVNKSGQVIGQYGGIGPNGEVGFNVSGNGTLTLRGVGTCPNQVHVPHLGAGGLSRLGPPGPSANRSLQECVDKLGIREVLSYQPLNRYWPFQFYEAAIFVGLALVLVGFSIWWVRRRLT